MRVWNISSNPIEYRGRSINPGGSLDFDAPFLPNRDQRLHGVTLHFGDSLPQWYLDKQEAAVPKPATQAVTMVDPIAVPAEVSVDVPAPTTRKK